VREILMMMMMIFGEYQLFGWINTSIWGQISMKMMAEY